MLKYQENPTQEDAVRLEQRFAELFETKTGYEALDERIAKSREKTAGLLAVLRHAEAPLHNNASELGIRARVRKRAASLGPRTAEGVRAWDTGMTLSKQLRNSAFSVNVYEYSKDRSSGANQVPSLAQILREKASQLRLRASWNSNLVYPNLETIQLIRSLYSLRNRYYLDNQ